MERPAARRVCRACTRSRACMRVAISAAFASVTSFQEPRHGFIRRVIRPGTLWHEGRQPTVALEDGRGASHPVRFPPGPVESISAARVLNAAASSGTSSRAFASIWIATNMDACTQRAGMAAAPWRTQPLHGTEVRGYEEWIAGRADGQRRVVPAHADARHAAARTRCRCGYAND